MGGGKGRKKEKKRGKGKLYLKTDNLTDVRGARNAILPARGDLVVAVGGLGAECIAERGERDIYETFSFRCLARAVLEVW